jgi:hypothetical protein
LCNQLAVLRLSAWLESQERMLRAWCHEAALDPEMDEGLLERLEQHCAWMSAQLQALEGAPNGPMERVQ